MRDDRAGSRSTDGYIDIKIDGRTYRAHRLAWLYTYGRWPTGQIDHRNGVRDDNRINNLRDVSRDVNAQNQRQAHRGKSTNLPIGVYPPDPRWGSSGYTAQIGVGGKKIKLGTFTTVGEAYAAYVSAKRRLHEGCTL